MSATETMCTGCGRHPGRFDAGNGLLECGMCQAGYLAHEARIRALARRFASVIADAHEAGFDDDMIDCALHDAPDVPDDDACATADLLPNAGVLLDRGQRLIWQGHDAQAAGDEKEAARLFAAGERLRLRAARDAGCVVREERAA